MSSETGSIVKNILKYDDAWCKALGIFNPYLDPYKVHFTNSLPMYDSSAYTKYPQHQFVYDKLLIAQTQNVPCGILADIDIGNGSGNGDSSDVSYPIFIKPRWGHKSASSKNCYKIKRVEDLLPHLDKEDMIWTDFIDARETMTDFLMVDGKVMYQMTSVYSDKQNGFIDDWKHISAKNEPPPKIVAWVAKHMTNYTGVCNVQYRGDIIIEVSLRLSRGGCYIKSTDNPNLVRQVNHIIDEGRWDHTITDLDYVPFYSFKCYTKLPIVYLLPQHVIDGIMRQGGCKSFYEYFFEPSGSSGMVFFQFLHHDFDEGMRVKRVIELVTDAMQVLFVLALLLIVVMFVYYPGYKNRWLVVYVVVLMFISRFINPLSTNYGLFKAQRQQMF
tara:strand:- start:3472 stop:4629 length:1158 start_codon:yes stop_codon:yes gene_type:complete